MLSSMRLGTLMMRLVIQHDAMLDLAVFDEDVVIDGGKWPDIRIDDACILAG